MAGFCRKHPFKGHTVRSRVTGLMKKPKNTEQSRDTLSSGNILVARGAQKTRNDGQKDHDRDTMSTKEIGREGKVLWEM